MQFSQQRPTFLLLEGLDGARVVHHGGVRSLSQSLLKRSRIRVWRNPTAQHVWSCGALALASTWLPSCRKGLRTDDAQTPSNTCLSAPHAPPLSPSATTVVMVTGGRGGPGRDASSSVLIYRVQISCRKRPEQRRSDGRNRSACQGSSDAPGYCMMAK